ncbi:P-loop containing nucleoside triphosphate hydrolase protein [Syncephalis fuscata]|nr:P-loop containing nucleoside triphosphate hydrolase protein [Syncephalis fuscata]
METIKEEEAANDVSNSTNINCSTCGNIIGDSTTNSSSSCSSCRHGTNASYASTSYFTEGISIAEKDVPTLASYRSLFRYANSWDYIMMVTGLILSIGSVILIPCYLLDNIFVVMEQYVRRDIPFNVAPTLYDAGFNYVIYIGVISIVALIIGFGVSACWEVVAERQAKNMRVQYYTALLRLSVPEHDRLDEKELMSRLSTDVLKAREGMGANVLPRIVQSVTTFVTGLIIAFIREWRLAAIMLSIAPVLLIVVVVMVIVVNRYAQQVAVAYMPADTIATKVLRAIRTIVSFGTIEKEVARYAQPLQRVETLAYRRVTTRAIASAVVYFLLYGSYAAAFWYAGTLVLRNELTTGGLVNVFFAVVLGNILAVGDIPPAIQRMGEARRAGIRIFDVIEHAQRMSTEGGCIITSVHGRIDFRSVDFRYPIAPNRPIIKNFSLTILPGETIAIVGTEGSGKSTLAQLLLRFYVAQFGTILIDGADISKANARSLRQVNRIIDYFQHPVIFTMSVMENVRMGGRNPNVPPSKEEVEAACRKAYAHEFISQLEDGYDTIIGDGGIELTIGQQQRIAIARAIIREPSILIMDEPTSSLAIGDEEKIIQQALEEASVKRTTLIVTHWPSAAQHAHRIVVLNDGEIIESGTHNQLLATRGAYMKLLVAENAEREAAKNETPDNDHSDNEEDEDNNNDANNEEEDDYGGEYIDPFADKQPKRSTNPETKVPVKDLKKKKDPKSKDQPPVQSIQDPDPPKHKLFIIRNGAKAGRIQKDIDGGKSHESDHLEETETKVPLIRLLKEAAPEKWFVLGGSLASMINGLVLPFFAWILAELLTSLMGVKKPDTLRQQSNFWALMVLTLANVSCLCRYAQGALFGRAGERLVGRLRVKALHNILHQRMAFFDKPENSTTALTQTLALDPVKVPPIITELWGEALLHLVTVVTGVSIAFAKGWNFAFLIIACFPAVSGASDLHVNAILRLGKRSAKAFERAVRIVKQSVPNFRMVIALGRDQTFEAYFEAASIAPYKVAIHAALISSGGYGLSQGLLIMIYAVSFGYGMSVVASDGYALRNMLIILFTIMFTITSGSTLMKLWGQYDEATTAALSVFRVMDAPTPDSRDLPDSPDKATPSPPSEDNKPKYDKGQITFRNVQFAFPIQPKTQVFRRLNLRIQPGRLVAIVGATQAGKSALIGMIPRFYDANKGRVEIDGQDVGAWSIDTLRAGMSLVEWDAALFGTTISECLEYGAVKATRNDAITAARYDTPIKDISSGELNAQRRQLIALGRALIRRPKVLLLDDPTRTSLIASSRISVAQHASTIVVLHHGRVVERGSHFDLLARRGYYYALACKQSVQRRVEPWDYMWSIGKKYVQTRSM